MRKFTLILTFLAFTGITFAQMAECALTVSGNAEKALATQQPKSFGDVIWSEDFDGAKWSGTVVADGQGYLLDPAATLPEGWIITDNNDLNYFWHWSDVGPRGRYTSPNASAAGGDASFEPNPNRVNDFPEGTSTSNGFMMLESDYFNTAPSGLISSDPIDMDASIEFGPIDMSNVPGAIFSMKTIFRTCCSATKLLGLAIGIPDGAGGITWSDEIRLNIKTPNNAVTYAAERSLDVPISLVKAGSDFISIVGEPEVYFRLHKTGASHYFWLIDDIKIYEPPTNDLIVEDTWFDYMYDALDPAYGQSSTASANFWGGYTQIPQSVVAPFIQFRTAVNNNGTADAVNAKMNVLIDKDGAEVYNVVSTPKTVAKFLRDTLLVAADYSPVDKGFYQVSMTVAMDAVDQAPSNNGVGYEFNVVENIYSRVTMGGEANFSTAGPGDWASGGYDGDAIAQPYDFPVSVTEVSLKAIKVYFAAPASADDETDIIAGNFAMYGRIYKLDETAAIVDAGIASDLYTVQITDTNTWVTLDLLDEGNLVVPGGQTYYVGIETYTGFVPTPSKHRRFEVGSDILGPKQPSTGGLVYLSSQGNWYLTGDDYAIDLVLNTNTVLVSSITVTGAGGATTISTLAGTLQMSAAVLPENAADKTIVWSLTNETGKATITADGLVTAQLDGTVTAVATAQDGSNVTGSMQITITGNVGISDMNLNAVTLTPNPFKGELVINNAQDVTQINVSNMLGQAVITVNEIANRQVLSTEGLNKGVYFVTIIDKNNNRRTERMVKQ